MGRAGVKGLTRRLQRDPSIISRLYSAYAADGDQRPGARRQTVVTDGSFAETREQLDDYFLIEANNFDETIGIAARISMARKGTGPVIDIPGLPTE